MSFFKPIFAKNKKIKTFKDMGFRHSVRLMLEFYLFYVY